VGEFYRFVTGKHAGETPRLLQGWRKKAVGDRLTQFLEGHGKIELAWEAGSLKAKSIHGS
jgi:hypothetical protein